MLIAFHVHVIPFRWVLFYKWRKEIKRKEEKKQQLYVYAIGSNGHMILPKKKRKENYWSPNEITALLSLINDLVCLNINYETVAPLSI